MQIEKSIIKNLNSSDHEKNIDFLGHDRWINFMLEL